MLIRSLLVADSIVPIVVSPRHAIAAVGISPDDDLPFGNGRLPSLGNPLRVLHVDNLINIYPSSPSNLRLIESAIEVLRLNLRRVHPPAVLMSPEVGLVVHFRGVHHNFNRDALTLLDVKGLSIRVFEINVHSI